MMPAEELTAAADKLEAIIAEASPGPWGYNSYSWVGSAPKMLAYEHWEYGEGHTLERAGKCEPCGDWRDPIDCLPNWTWPRGHGCKLFDVDYDMDPEVISVRSHHGDTAIRSRKADAEYIEAMNPLVGKALADWLREQSSAAAVRDGHSPTALKIARLINGGVA